MIFVGVAVLVLAAAIVYHALTRPNPKDSDMSAFSTALDANTQATADNTTATNGLIAALNAGEPTADQIAALTANTTQIVANTTAANNAANPPAAEPAQ